MARWLLAALILAPCAAVAADRVATVVEPDWAELPSPELLSANYPKAPLLLEIEGLAQISCDVDERGRLSGCSVDREVPADLGFGVAAIRMSSSFRMKPRLFAGVPVSGGTVCIPVRFTLPPRSDARRPAGPPSAEALRAVDALELAPLFLASLDADLTALEQDDGAATPKASRAAASAALRRAIEARKSGARDALAQAMTADLSRDEIMAFHDFAGSPGAAVLQRSGEEVAAAITRAVPRMSDLIGAEVSRTLCGRETCDGAGLPLQPPSSGASAPVAEQAPSPAVQAARELMAALDPIKQMEPGIGVQLARLKAASETGDPVSKMTAELVEKALRRVLADLVDEAAVALAASSREDDIRAATAFITAPAARRIASSGPDAPGLSSFASEIAAAARTTYCQDHDCTRPPPPR
ncbi:MAG: TonB family protein [Phenylobacterium sp.]|nr:TonB family protein [Phenylobacterium sp.]